MRPTAIESIRGMQASLFEVIAPEVKSPFAQHTLQTMFMLLESLAGEMGAEEGARSDSARIDSLLESLKEAVAESGSENEELLAVIEGLPASDDAGRIALLERAIVALEPADGDLAPSLQAVRQEMYRYLREVAGRGWSFWDMLSFRRAPS